MRSTGLRQAVLAKLVRTRWGMSTACVYWVVHGTHTVQRTHRLATTGHALLCAPQLTVRRLPETGVLGCPIPRNPPYTGDLTSPWRTGQGMKARVL